MTEISYSGRRYDPWARLCDEQITVFAFLLRKKKSFEKLKLIKLEYFGIE